MDSDAAASLEAFGYHSTLPGTTTISTIVLHSGPVKLVVALLQSGEQFHIKVVEAEPRLTFLGGDLDEAILLQRQHDEVLRKLQDNTNPVDEFLRKVDQMIETKRPRAEVLDAMEQSIKTVWDDMTALLHRRKLIADTNANFHEKLGGCRGKMGALEEACRDTMIPIEVEPVEEFLSKIRELRTDVLASVMSALREGNELLAQLKDIATEGSLDSRPDHIKFDAIKSISLVEVWLEDLHDRRNSLEVAWQSRKSQLEQCLQLAVLVKELEEIEAMLHRRESDMSISFTLGDTESIVDNLLREYVSLKDDAILLRDRALKVAKATEELVRSDCFAGDEACARAYSVLSRCTDFFDETDRRENWLLQAKDFFHRAEEVLATLESMEAEVAAVKVSSEAPEAISVYTRLLSRLNGLIDVPVQMGYCLMDDVGRTQPEVMGVKRVVDELENRKIYLEKVCSINSEKHVTVSEHINNFFLHYNEILSWLVSTAESLLKNHNTFGRNLPTAHEFLTAQHQLLSDLEGKGREINKLLTTLAPILEEVDEEQRRNIDEKVEALQKHWTDVKNIAEARVDLVSLYIQFLDESESLAKTFDQIEAILKTSPNEENLQRIQKAWTVIQPAYTEIKLTARRFIDEASKVADPYLETKSACSRVDEILNDFSSRQFSITESWENWTQSITTKRKTELLWEKIMSENVHTLNAASKLDAQLYPVLSIASNDPSALKIFVTEKLTSVLGDIAKAKGDLQERITATSSLDAKDESTTEKLQQVIENLSSIKNRLDRIANEYEALVISIVSFLEAISTTKTRIEEYFATQKVINRDSAERVVSDHEAFRDNVKAQFRSLISQSETIIERIRTLEPNGAKEHDTDRIITLLEQLRMTFETQIESKSSELKEQQQLGFFNKELKEIHGNLDDMTKQLEDTELQQCETLAAISTKSIAFEYFERTIDLLGKRIDNFRKSGENIASTYPNTRSYIEEELQKLVQRWEEFSERAQKSRTSIDLSIAYFKLLYEINAQYRIHSTYLSHTNNTVQFVSTVEQANELVHQIDDYIDQNEAAQLKKLKKLSEISVEIYGLDKTVTTYTENLSLFQSFLKLKADLNDTIAKLKEEESREKIEKVEKLQITEIQTPQHKPPVFTQTLINATIQEGERFTFECIVTGSPIPSIEWLKDGISIQSNSDYKTVFVDGFCSLSIEETLAEDSATFTCKATNVAGSAETTATLTVKENVAEEVLEPPVFTEPLQPGYAKEGATFEFRCTATGYPLPVVEWFKNDVCIDQSPDYIITFNNGLAILKFEHVFLEDQALFTCRASNTSGMVQTSANLMVEPLEPTEVPAFKVPLSNVMARVGQKIKLECEVTGIPRPELFWTHNGKLFIGRDSKLLMDGDRVTLLIPEAFFKDTGIYTLTAKNLAGEVSNSCNVCVKGRVPNETSDSEFASDMEPIKPSVQLPLKNTSVFEGKSVRLDCVIVGQPEPEVIWYHNDRPVKESADIQLLFQGDRCSLLIHEAYIEDAGEYKVVAINSAGETSSVCQLTVTPLNTLEPATRMSGERIQSTVAPPKFEKLLVDVLASEGEKVIFDCLVVGDPRPEVKWLLNNREIAPSDRIQMSYADDGAIKLIIENVTTDDKGLYTVKATNSSGESKCFSHLIVKSVNVADTQRPAQEILIEDHYICPMFKELFSDRVVRIDDSTKFECIVIGKPTPKVRWYFNDEPVHGKNFLVSTSGDRQVLTIPAVTSETTGKISCVAENEIGKATCVAYVNLEGAYEPPLVASPQTYTQEHHTQSSLVTLKKQMFTTTSTQQVSSVANNIPQTQIHTSHQAPDTIESRQFQEYHQSKDLAPSFQQKSVVNVIRTNLSDVNITKPTRKYTPPRFISPLIGKIVDQGANVVLEAVVDGYPSPEVKVTKNGEPIENDNHINVNYNFNKVTIQLNNVTVPDAGRYICTANNAAGTSTSVADLVVKKSIFPPVFGHRLQTQIAKLGERVIMDVEITGLPEPTVTWFKDDLPLNEASVSTHKVQKMGNCYKLIIENASLTDAGKYMVSAVNPGGKAESIASFAVMEKTPERVVEVIKTVVYEDPKDHTRKGSEESSAIIRAPGSSHSAHTVSHTETDMHGSEESTILTETRRTTEATMRMEHKVSFPDLPPLTFSQNTQTLVTPVRHEATMSDQAEVRSSATNTDKMHTKSDATQTPPQVPPKPSHEEESTIQTQSITKKSALEFFEHKIQSEPVTFAEDKYTKFSDIKMSPAPLITQPQFDDKLSSELRSLNLEPGPAPEIGFMPKADQVKRENISDRIKRLESVHKETESPSGGVRVFPQMSRTEEPGSVSPRPSAEGVAMEKLWASAKPHDTFISDVNEVKKSSEQQSYSFVSTKESHIGTLHPAPEHREVEDHFKKYSINSAKKVFEERIKEVPDLVAPQLVRQVSEKTERPKSVHEIFHDIHLEPGSPPEVCYAPKPTFARKKSLVETLEESLEKKIESEPTRVPPGGVRIVPPPKREKSLPPTLPPRDYAPLIPPPSVPTTCLKSDVSEAEYSSDFDSLPWSKTSEFRHVEAPKFSRDHAQKFNVDQPAVPLRQTITEGKPITLPSGYMADTEEYHSTKISHHDTQFVPNASQTKHYRHHNHKHDRTQESSGTDLKEYSTASLIKNISVTTTQYKYLDDNQLEPLPFKADPPQAKRPRIPPPPSPSKFIKGEFRESDYESDYEGRIAPIWRPTDSDSEPQYRPVRVNLTPTGRRSCISDGQRSPTPPSEFDRRPPQFEGTPRPKFEPIDKVHRVTETSYSHTTKQHHQPFVHKPTPVTSTRYFTGIAGTPVHNTIATETSNTMHMREHTETSRRVVNMNQTTRVIKFDGGQKKSDFEQHLEPFPYAPTNGDTSPRPRVSLPPTPTKFVKGDFRESDYESEVDSARIRPLWTPNPLDSDEPQYRRVAPPHSTRSASCPRSYPTERVLTPMEFDTQPPLMPEYSAAGLSNEYKTQTLDRYSTKKVHQYSSRTQDDTHIRQSGTANDYGYPYVRMKDMGSSLKSKASQFMRDISSDIKRPSTTQKPILKKTTSIDNEPQAYREESRISQYGTKHIDPDTGLIYFKYDFGYEFGILFPGEGKKFVGGSGMSTDRKGHQIQRTGDIELPVLHERTHIPSAMSNGTGTNWGPNKRYSLPININIDQIHQPMASTGAPYTKEHQRDMSQRTQTPVNYSREDKPKKPPSIITPLKDIAVVAGQTARFECIIQCEPHPEVIWSKNGVMIGRSLKHHIEFRNGVCRLTIPHAFTEDAGTYSCTATNQLGSVTTSADLLVPGNKWGYRK